MQLGSKKTAVSTENTKYRPDMLITEKYIIIQY